MLWSYLGYCLEQEGRLEEAIDELSGAAERFPETGRLWVELAGLYFAAGERDHALEAVERARRSGSLDFLDHQELADTLAKGGLADEALEEAREATRAAPQRSEPLRSLSTHGRKSGQYDVAVRAARDATELHPSSVANWDSLVWALLAKEDLEEALCAARRRLELAPDRASSLETLCEVIFYAGDVDEQRLGERAVELHPESRLAWLALGESHLSRGQWEEARTALETSIKLGYDGCTASSLLGVALFHLGERERARAISDGEKVGHSKSCGEAFCAASRTLRRLLSTTNGGESGEAG